MSNKEENLKEQELSVLNPIDVALLGAKVSIGEDGELLSNTDKKVKYRVVLRSPTRAGEKEQSSRARNLKACKGLKGCEFAQCVRHAFGRLPKNLNHLCLTKEEQ